ncbi:MAG: hypothetical protein WCK59_00385 [Candidatus Falkowbacteria bacterium]
METKENIIFQMLDDSEGLCGGSLWYYFSIIYKAPNISNPYHNLRHLMYVVCQVYVGGKFMKYYELTSNRSFRALLIAAMFHDYAHSGVMGHDKDEVDRSVLEAKKYLLKSDMDLEDEVTNFIRATQFPYVECKQNLGVDIIRDADMSQLFDDEWIQQVILGLSLEMKITPLQMLQSQLVFIPAMTFHTKWAKESFSPLVDVRLMEVKKMLENLQ